MKPFPLPAQQIMSLRGDNSAEFSSRLTIFAILCAILYFGQDIFIPIVLALLLAILLVPIVRLLQRARLPRGLAVLTVVIATILAFSGTAYVVGRTLSMLAADLPTYEANLRERAKSLKLATGGSTVFDRAAGVLKDLQLELDRPDSVGDPVSVPTRPIPVEVHDTRFGALQPVISMIDIVAHPLVQFGIVILMLIFILFNREDLRNRLIRLAGTDDIHRTTIALDEAGQRLSRLFLGQLAINTFTGMLIGGCLFLLGIPGAALWGMLTIGLRFVPLIGTMIGSVFPIIIALAVSDGWWLPAVVAAVVICAELFANQVLETVFLGRMTGVSSTAIVISAAFWASLWGPIGLILATPMTVGMLVVGRHIEALRFLDILLGNETVLSPDHLLYQRLLASDTMEAVESAQDYAARNDRQDFLESVAIPTLRLAQSDIVRGALSREKAIELTNAFLEVLDEISADLPETETGESPVAVVAQPGAVNFAAAATFSALLRLKGIPHQLLPQDAVAQGGFPELDTTSLRHVCIVGLRAPTSATIRYLKRRIGPHTGEAGIMDVAWYSAEDRPDVLTPVAALSLLPTTPSAAANSERAAQ